MKYSKNKGNFSRWGNWSDADGRLINGYDYEKQAWVKDGHYIRCGHPLDVDCKCYGKEHEGEETTGHQK